MHIDRISKAVEGRYFPSTVGEITASLDGLAFAVPSYSKRLPIIMENVTIECESGHQLCSFMRMGYVAVFSLPDLVPPAMARRATEVALERFSEIDKGPWLSVRTQQFVVYRAFLGPMGRLSIAQHVINGVSRSYLQFRHASQLSKATRTSKGLQEILTTQVV